MILVDMLTEEEQKKPDSFPQRWREGRLATQPGMATIVLAVVLVLTILAAQLMVSARSGIIDAIENAQSLIEQVSEKGLSEYFPSQTMVRYYIFEDNGQPIAFAIHTQGRQRRGDNSWDVVGKSWKYNVESRELSESLFFVTNDLRNYRYKQTIEIRNRIFSIHARSLSHEIKNGILKGNAFPPTYLHQPNIIPWALLDFFTCRVVGQAEPTPCRFIVVNPNLISSTDEEFDLLWELDIQSTDAIPAEVKQSFPHGYSAEISNAATNTSWLKYYDKNNRLIWQKDLTTQEICRIVESVDELDPIFPGSRKMISDWLPEELIKKESKDDQEIL